MISVSAMFTIIILFFPIKREFYNLNFQLIEVAYLYHDPQLSEKNHV